ncbi:MAG: cyclase family protein [Actinomycetes bacterium]
MAVHDLVSALSSATLFDLEHDRYTGAAIYPGHWPGFVYTLHRHHETVEGQHRTSASGTIMMAEHSGTHIDALCHQALDMELFGGIRVTPSVQTPRGFTQLGVETIAPIMRRGVLLDVARARGVDFLEAGYLVTAEDLQAAVDAHGVVIEEGDCILVRTGWGQNFEDADAYLDAAGISAEGAQWLADRKPFLCGADNVAFDYPDNVDIELGLLPSHTILIVRNGIYIVENLNLEELAQSAHKEFLFLCMPLKLRGVTGSPVRPVAIAQN